MGSAAFGDDRRRAMLGEAAHADPALLRAREAITSLTEDWTSLLQALIRIPSRHEAEHDIVRWVAEYVRALGLSPTLVAMDAAALRRHPDSSEPVSEVPGRHNVVVRLPGRGAGRSLILNCHLDVQPEGDPRDWTHPPFSGHVDPTTHAIYGRGAMDDKAGVALCLGLMRILVERGVQLDGDLTFHFVLEDEITGNGSRP
jgi:acetylornithine deacetylase